MSNQTVAAMTAASALDGTELYYSVQGGVNRKVTGAQIKTLASASPTLVTPTLSGAIQGAALATGAVNANSGTAIPAGGTAGAGLKVSSATNFGVFFGSGAPSLAAAKGSLYLRSDGSGVNDRMYVNTDGSTTWTPVVTVG